MVQLKDSDLKLLEQIGGSEDPQLIPGSSLFEQGERVTMADGRPITSLAEKSLDFDLGIPQAGGARRSRRSRKRLTRRRRSVRGKSRGKYLLNLHLRISSRQRQSRRQRHRS
jgi:hypothetical protein